MKFDPILLLTQSTWCCKYYGGPGAPERSRIIHHRASNLKSYSRLPVLCLFVRLTTLWHCEPVPQRPELLQWHQILNPLRYKGAPRLPVLKSLWAVPPCLPACTLHKCPILINLFLANQKKKKKKKPLATPMSWDFSLPLHPTPCQLSAIVLSSFCSAAWLFFYFLGSYNFQLLS